MWSRRCPERGWNTFRCLAPRSSVLALSVVAGRTLMVFLPSEPLMGYAFRYLVNGQNGLVLDDELTVTVDGEEVHFPWLTP